ncbi:hypothetical protein [uncultured Roseovarius sp.]|uniref:hypothetical protein n=1 Tax=uncultured Roseovarius sp. TaxID=293344 RepID=UPI0026232C9B|nr:hypothetical protein [uncultured Roseovarius sp.]
MNRPATVKQIDITRAVKGAVNAGFAVGKIEIDQIRGKVTIYPEGAAAQAAGPDPDELLR